MKMFLIIFVGFGLLAIPALVCFIVCGTTTKTKIKGSIIILLFWLGTSIACWGQSTGNAERWNDGHCECGAHWELSAVAHIKTSTIKYYTCPECFNEIEIRE